MITEKETDRKIDILTREDIVKLVDEFYVEVRKHSALGPIFDELMHVDWNKHLPKMYNFWENVLWQTGAYKGFPFAAHLPVNKQRELSPGLFDEWLRLFHGTVDRLFEGENAEQLKAKSATIKGVWSYKMEYINNYKED